MAIVRKRLENALFLHCVERSAVCVAPFLVVSASIELQGILKLGVGLRNDPSVFILSEPGNQLCRGAAQRRATFGEGVQELGEDHFGGDQARLVWFEGAAEQQGL